MRRVRVLPRPGRVRSGSSKGPFQSDLATALFDLICLGLGGVGDCMSPSPRARASDCYVLPYRVKMIDVSSVQPPSPRSQRFVLGIQRSVCGPQRAGAWRYIGTQHTRPPRESRDPSDPMPRLRTHFTHMVASRHLTPPFCLRDFGSASVHRNTACGVEFAPSNARGVPVARTVERSASSATQHAGARR